MLQLKAIGWLLLKALALFALPTIVFQGGIWVMSKMSGAERVEQKLIDNKVAEEDRPSLQRRFRGYDRDAVARHWQAKKAVDQLRAEQRLLEIDLIFPFLYGAALAVSMLLAWAWLDRRFNPAWVIVPVIIQVLADWTENLTLLSQLKRFIASDAAGLQAGVIRIASLATQLKWLLLIGNFLLLAALVIAMFFYRIRPFSGATS